MVTRTDLLELEPRWHRLRSMLAASAGPELPRVVRNELADFQGELLESIFAGPPLYDRRREDLDPADPRLTIALDILAALSVSEPDDPSYPWERGGLLFTVGRHLEAAEEYLAAAGRFSREFVASTGTTGDEEAWAESALFHAAKNLVQGGHALAAAALVPRLAADDRAEIAQLVEEARAPAAAG
jgi:hypothetical protein